MSNASARVNNRDTGFRRGHRPAGKGPRAYIEPISSGRDGRVRMAKVTWAMWRSKLNSVNAALKHGTPPVKEIKDMTEGERREIEARYGAKIKRENSP